MRSGERNEMMVKGKRPHPGLPRWPAGFCTTRCQALRDISNAAGSGAEAVEPPGQARWRVWILAAGYGVIFRMRIFRYCASPAGPPWIWTAIRPFCSIFSSGSV